MEQPATQLPAAPRCKGNLSSCSEGEEVVLYDGRPNGELMMATGSVQTKNPADYLTIEVDDCLRA
jgi:hypothetical protein